MGMKPQSIVALVIAMILMGLLIPIGLNGVLAFTSTNATIQTLVSVVLPIMAVIGIVLSLVPRGGGTEWKLVQNGLSELPSVLY